jgi:hypothetical protein
LVYVNEDGTYKSSVDKFMIMIWSTLGNKKLEHSHDKRISSGLLCEWNWLQD